MSSSSSMRSSPGCKASGEAAASLHLVEHLGERPLELERLLDLFRADVRVLTVFEEARPLVLVEELRDREHVRLPVLGPAFEVGEDRVDARRVEDLEGVLDVLVEVGVEDALVHEVETRA